jgi:hypothetical protein
MIVETAIISVAAIVISALATGNAIHKRVIAWEKDDGRGEERRLLERDRRGITLRPLRTSKSGQRHFPWEGRP